MPEIIDGMPLPKLFHDIPEGVYQQVVESLYKMRVAHTREGSPSPTYRDDELLLFLLCQTLILADTLEPPVTTPEITITSKFIELEPQDDVLEACRHLVLLDRERQAHKDYFEAHRQAVAKVVELVGDAFHFQDEQGVVYRFVEPEGTFVKFEKLALERTRRPNEKKGSMSMEDGRRLGYLVEGK